MHLRGLDINSFSLLCFFSFRHLQQSIPAKQQQQQNHLKTVKMSQKLLFTLTNYSQGKWPDLKHSHFFFLLFFLHNQTQSIQSDDQFHFLLLFFVYLVFFGFFPSK